MTDLVTPLATGTSLVTVGGKLGPIPDAAGADAMGLVTASPAAFSLLGRLKAIADAVGAGGGSGGGDASAANQATEIVRLTSILVAVDGLEALIAATNTALGGTLAVAAAALPLPAGAATQATLAALLAKMIAAPATEAKQDATIAGNAPFSGRVAMTVGTAVAPGRAIEIVASAAGNVSLTFADGSTTVVSVAAGTTILDYAVTTINAAGTTATATYGKLI